MSTFYPAVVGQVQYACSVLAFIKALLKAVLPSLARSRSILGTEESFKSSIDKAFAGLDHLNTCETDYRLAVADAACREVAILCDLLIDACTCAGLEELARRYLDPKRFVRLVLKMDAAKLESLRAVVDSHDRNIGRLLMRVGAVLDDRPDIYDDMDASAKRKATLDTKKIVEKVEEMRRTMTQHKSEIVERINDVGAKVEEVKSKVGKVTVKGKRGRRFTYSVEQVERCCDCWDSSQRILEVRHAINTRITYDSAFSYWRRKLAEVGIDTVKKFKAAIHSKQNRECEARKRALEAQREAARKAKRSAKPRKR